MIISAVVFISHVVHWNRRGIVHRDMKAANLLIDEHDVSFSSPVILFACCFFAEGVNLWSGDGFLI